MVAATQLCLPDRSCCVRNTENFGLPAGVQGSDEPIVPNAACFVSLDPASDTSSQSSSGNDAQSDPSDAAGSNHANVQREDDEILRHLPRDVDGCVHIQQMSSYVSESANETSQDGLADDLHQMKLMVSDARKFGNERDDFAWVKAFPYLFQFGRYETCLHLIANC